MIEEWNHTAEGEMIRTDPYLRIGAKFWHRGITRNAPCVVTEESVRLTLRDRPKHPSRVWLYFVNQKRAMYITQPEEITERVEIEVT